MGQKSASIKMGAKGAREPFSQHFTGASGVDLKVAICQQIADDRRVGKRVVGGQVDILQHNGLGRGRRTSAIDDIGIVAVEAA